MAIPQLTYRTSDGREFEDIKTAEVHQSLINEIDAFMEAEQVGESRRRNLRLMLIRWMERYGNARVSTPSID